MPPQKKGSDNRDVLSSLPRSRPQRPSARREKARAAATPAGAEPTAAKPAAAERTSAKRTSAKPTAAKRKPAKPKAPAATAQAKKGAAGPKVPRGVPPAGYATPQTDSTSGPPSGKELISTAVKAAGELVEIGTTLGRQALESALSRLPRP